MEYGCGGRQRAGSAAGARAGAIGEDGRATGAGAAAWLGRDAAAVLLGYDGPQASAECPREGALVSLCFMSWSGCGCLPCS